LIRGFADGCYGNAATWKARFFPELTDPLHRLDRVGTYGNLTFAEVL